MQTVLLHGDGACVLSEAPDAIGGLPAKINEPDRLAEKAIIRQRHALAHEDALRLAARLRAARSDAERVLMFTGAAESENIGLVTCEVGQALVQLELGPVLIVDAKLHRPSLHGVLDTRSSPGLADVLKGQASLADCIHPSPTMDLHLLPCGDVRDDSRALFSSSELETVLRSAKQRFRYVLIDAPPINQYVSTALLATQAEGAIIVLDSGHSRRGEVVEIKRELDSLKSNILGVVLCEKGKRSRFHKKVR